MTPDWRAFALASALFAALTAILGKIGVREVNLRSCDIFPHRHHSTTERTHRERAPRQPLGALSRTSMIALGLSGVATGLSWLCYYRALQWGPASRVAPVDKLSGAFIIISIILIRNLRSKSHLRWVAHEIDG
jgi:transporter family protein